MKNLAYIVVFGAIFFIASFAFKFADSVLNLSVEVGVLNRTLGKYVETYMTETSGEVSVVEVARYPYDVELYFLLGGINDKLEKIRIAAEKIADSKASKKDSASKPVLKSVEPPKEEAETETEKNFRQLLEGMYYGRDENQNNLGNDGEGVGPVQDLRPDN